MQEKINDILAQETLDEKDINFLMAHLDQVSEIGKARLGFIPVIEAKTIDTPKAEPTPKVETPKKRSRRLLKRNNALTLLDGPKTL